jgi:hypothetical protein
MTYSELIKIVRDQQAQIDALKRHLASLPARFAPPSPASALPPGGVRGELLGIIDDDHNVDWTVPEFIVTDETSAEIAEDDQEEA